MKNERPPWPFSCYAHKRDAPSDLLGDFSFEEVSDTSKNVGHDGDCNCNL